MTKTWTMLAAATLAMVAGAMPAQAAYTLGGQAVPTMTYTTADKVAAGLTGGSYTGVGSLFITSNRPRRRASARCAPARWCRAARC